MASYSKSFLLKFFPFSLIRKKSKESWVNLGSNFCITSNLENIMDRDELESELLLNLANLDRGTVRTRVIINF